MKLREEILREHSRAQKDKIVKWIGNDQARFDELFRLFLNDERRVIQRAAWPLSFAAGRHPELIKKHLGKLIRNLRTPGLHDAVKRNTMRILQVVDIPLKLQGEIMNTCFAYIMDPGEKAAVKAFSLTVLDNLSGRYPDIKNEIRTIIEERWDLETPAFHSRARKIIGKQMTTHGSPGHTYE